MLNCVFTRVSELVWPPSIYLKRSRNSSRPREIITRLLCFTSRCVHVDDLPPSLCVRCSLIPAQLAQFKNALTASRSHYGFYFAVVLFHGWNVLSPKNVTFVSSECQGMPSMPVQSLPGIFSSLLLAFWPNNWHTGSVFWVRTWLGSFSGASNCTEDGPPLGLPLVFAPVSPLFYQMAVKGLVCPSQPCLFS